MWQQKHVKTPVEEDTLLSQPMQQLGTTKQKDPWKSSVRGRGDIMDEHVLLFLARTQMIPNQV
jgi:hypothetical protein